MSKKEDFKAWMFLTAVLAGTFGIAWLVSRSPQKPLSGLGYIPRSAYQFGALQPAIVSPLGALRPQIVQQPAPFAGRRVYVP